MFTFYYTEAEPNIVSDNLFKAIKECPFERNKDVSNWGDSKYLYDITVKNTFGHNANFSNVVNKSITIEDPVVSQSNDMDSYLVVDLLVEVHNEPTRLIHKFPISY